MLLIAFRVLQGIAAAMIAPTSLAIVLDSFPVERRAAGRRALGRAPRRPRRRSGRPSAARWSSSPTGASSSSSTCRSAPRSSSPAAAACRGRRSSTAACPTCPARRCWRSALATVTLGDRRGQRLGLDARPRPSAASPLAALLLAARRPPQPQPPAPDRRAGALRPPLLPRRQPRHPALRRRLLLADPRQRPLPHLDLGLHRAPGRRRDAARPGALDRRRRPRRHASPTASATAP